MDTPSGVLILNLVLMGPVGGLFLNEGPYKVMHYHQLKVWFIKFPDPVYHFLYHEVMVDLGLGQTSIHQEPWVKCAPLGFTLVSQHVKHVISGVFGYLAGWFV